MCTFGVLGLSCASPGGPVWWGRRGHDNQRAQTCTFEGPALQTPPKFHEKDQQEREKRIKIVAGEGKKRAKFWAVRRRAVRRRGVRRRGPEHNNNTQHTTTTTTTTKQQHNTNNTKQHTATTQNTNPHQNQPQHNNTKNG